MNRKVKIGDNRFFGAFLAFTIVFFTQIVANHFVITLRSLPDEMGAIYLASKWAGNDWSYVMTHPALYYGSLQAPFLYPFFILIEDPIILYHCLLGTGAFLRSLPALVCFYISVRYLKIDNCVIAFLLSVSCCFFTPTRASNIDNEPGLILCGWLLILLIISLMQMPGYRKTVIESVLLAVILCVSLLAHTRAILYSIIVLGTMIIFHFLTLKPLVNYKWFWGTYVILYIFVNKVISYLTGFLYPVNDANTDVLNTSGGLLAAVENGVGKFFSKYGIQSFLDLFSSNIIVTFIFGIGIILYCIWFTVLRFFSALKERIYYRRKIAANSTLFPFLFCVMGGCAGIIGVSITWIEGAINLHLNSINLSRGNFYLRYYSFFFGPLLMLFTAEIIHNKNFSEIKKTAILSGLTVVIAFSYCWESFLSFATGKYAYNNSDWFYYFAPLSFSFSPWPSTCQSAEYYIIAIENSVLLFSLLLILVKKKKNIIWSSFLMCFLIYQYIYGVVFWDVPFCASDNYYQSVDAIYSLSKEHPDVFANIDEIYYINPVYGPQYIVQFFFRDIPVILEYPEDEEQEFIFTSSLDNIQIEDECLKEYKYLRLDDNELLVIKGEVYFELFETEGIKLLPLAEKSF